MDRAPIAYRPLEHDQLDLIRDIDRTERIETLYVQQGALFAKSVRRRGQAICFARL